MFNKFSVITFSVLLGMMSVGTSLQAMNTLPTLAQHEATECPICYYTYTTNDSKHLGLPCCTSAKDLCSDCINKWTVKGFQHVIPGHGNYGAEIHRCPYCRQEFNSEDFQTKTQYIIAKLKEKIPSLNNTAVILFSIAAITTSYYFGIGESTHRIVDFEQFNKFMLSLLHQSVTFVYRLQRTPTQLSLVFAISMAIMHIFSPLQNTFYNS